MHHQDLPILNLIKNAMQLPDMICMPLWNCKRHDSCHDSCYASYVSNFVNKYVRRYVGVTLAVIWAVTLAAAVIMIAMKSIRYFPDRLRFVMCYPKNQIGNFFLNVRKCLIKIGSTQNSALIQGNWLNGFFAQAAKQAMMRLVLETRQCCCPHLLKSGKRGTCDGISTPPILQL